MTNWFNDHSEIMEHLSRGSLSNARWMPFFPRCSISSNKCADISSKSVQLPDHDGISFTQESHHQLKLGLIGLHTRYFILTIIAVVISCLGLFTLAAFTASKPTEKMGIRKVIGATIGDLLTLLSSEYFKLTILVTAIGLL